VISRGPVQRPVFPPVTCPPTKSEYIYAPSSAIYHCCIANIAIYMSLVRIRFSIMAEITTKRGKQVKNVDGYLYRPDRQSADGGQFWRCLTDGCKGRIKTNANGAFVEYRNQTHCHPRNAEDVTVRATVTRMNARAEAETTSLVEIYRSETAALSGQPTTAAAMPTYHEVCLRLCYCFVFVCTLCTVDSASSQTTDDISSVCKVSRHHAAGIIAKFSHL